MHGTAVTGIIGARRGNGVGVVGVLNNENVCYVTASVFGDDAESGARQSDVLSAVAWVADQGERRKTNFRATDMLELPAGNSEIFELTTCLLFCFVLPRIDSCSIPGADVINLSLGGPFPSTTARRLYAEIRARNRLVFAACGNDGTTDLFYPASYDEVSLPDVVRFRNAHSGPMMFTVRSS